jgi:hypothetical protein
MDQEKKIEMNKKKVSFLSWDKSVFNRFRRIKTEKTSFAYLNLFSGIPLADKVMWTFDAIVFSRCCRWFFVVQEINREKIVFQTPMTLHSNYVTQTMS